jgi:hypothetical protein
MFVDHQKRGRLQHQVQNTFNGLGLGLNAGKEEGTDEFTSILHSLPYSCRSRDGGKCSLCTKAIKGGRVMFKILKWIWKLGYDSGYAEAVDEWRESGHL